ncbi:MAG: PstS family phosphate ABC transporter substrate-binding protein [Planctomycetales bacterium]|nr:PstS family phosphate ABC transporter substrate-binding protein [Planctomycetales bacterium]
MKFSGRRNPAAFLVLSLALAALVAGCNNKPADSGGGSTASSELAGMVQISGSSTVAPITEVAIEEFGNDHGDVKLSMAVTGTSAGMSRFLLDEIDICNASRPIKDTEKDKAKEAGIEFLEFTVAYDGLAVVINPQNDWCDSLTVEQLKAIWEPEAKDTVTKWSDVNAEWPNEEMPLFGPGTASGTFEYFTEEIVGEAKSSRPDYTRSEDDNVLVRGVAGEKGGLGYFGYAYYAENKDKLKLVAVDSGAGPVKPSLETVMDGTYTPLSRPLFIYVNKKSLERPEVAEFVKFYLANAGEFASARGYVRVTDEIAAHNKELLDGASK